VKHEESSLSISNVWQFAHHAEEEDYNDEEEDYKAEEGQEEPGTKALIEGEFDDDEDEDFDEGACLSQSKPLPY
jgi:hypothetical protein